MATVKQNYIKLQEGKISRTQFMEAVRKDVNLKSIISPLQSYKDVVQVLKNKRIIESIGSDEKLNKSFKHITSLLSDMNSYDDEEVDLLIGDMVRNHNLSNDEARELGARVFEWSRAQGDSDDNYEDGGYDDLDEELADDEIDSEFEIPKDSPYDLYTDKIQQLLRDHGADDDEIVHVFEAFPELIRKNYKGGISPEDTLKTIFRLAHDTKDTFDLNEAQSTTVEYDEDEVEFDKKNISGNEFTAGWKLEYQNQKVKDIAKAKELAVKNLSKDPIYYTNLLAGKGKNKPVKGGLPGTGYIEVTKANHTDKIAPSKQIGTKDKASANKAKKETIPNIKVKEETMKPQRAKGIKQVMDLPGKEKKIKISEIRKIAQAFREALKESKLK